MSEDDPHDSETATVFAVQLQSDLEVETREGWLKANKGDYLVVNSRDRTYPWPVKKEIFESTYAEIIPQKLEAKQ